jgi:hypothetical protein
MSTLKEPLLLSERSALAQVRAESFWSGVFAFFFLI